MKSICDIIKTKHEIDILEGATNFTIRPKGKVTRLFIDNEYVEQGYLAKFPRYVTPIYLVLARHSNAKTQTCFPSISTIQTESGIKNRNSVVGAIKILEDHNIISVDHSRGRRPNFYTLLDIVIWKPINGITTNTVVKSSNNINCEGQQYQNEWPNSITSDTGNHISKSNNEINHKPINKLDQIRQELEDQGVIKRSMSGKIEGLTSSDKAATKVAL